MCAWLCLADSVRLIIVAISAIAYVLFLVFLRKGRRMAELKSPFFLLFFATGVSDLITAFYQNVLLKVSAVPWAFDCFIALQPVSTFGYYFMSWYCPYAQAIGLGLITYNRYDAICKSLRYESIWTRQRVSISIFIQFIAPALIAAPVMPFYNTAYYTRVNGSIRITPNINVTTILYPAFPKHYSFLLVATAGFVVPLIFLLAYLRMFFFLKSHQKRTERMARHSRPKSSEIRLAVSGCVLVATMLFLSAANIVKSVFETRFTKFLTVVAFDTYTLSNVYVMLACSAVVRQQFLRFLNCKFGHEPVPVREARQSSTVQMSMSRGSV